MTRELEPITPEDALELYLSHREQEISDATYRAHRIRLQHFIRWCDEHGIDNLNEITGRKLHEYRLWRKNDGDLNRVSVRTQLSSLRVFIRFCARIDAVSDGLGEAVDVPELDRGENARSVEIKVDRVEKILEQLNKFHYASRKHVIVRLLWETGVRIGTLRGIDVQDVNLQENFIELQHRPDVGCPLKNGAASERIVSIQDRTVTVLEDWLEEKRPKVTDEHNCEPLLATSRGRIGTNTIRQNVYRVTCPQFYGEDCSCDVDEHEYHDSSKCEDSVSPHPFRRGSLTHQLRHGVPHEVVSDRCDVGRDVLDKHYNTLSEFEKMERRREYLSNL